MWGRRLRLLFDDLAAQRARREELTRRVESQQTIITFLCQRVNQLETERALLFRQLTNIDLPVPRFHVTPTVAVNTTTAGPTIDALDAITALGIFEDDPSHAPAGWHADGSVNYGRLPVPDPAAVS